MSPEKFSPLDPIVHSPIRLAVFSTLITVKEAEFNYLKKATNTTDGNLSTHLAKLEEAGYVSVKKTFRGKKPLTKCSLTERGRVAFRTYLKSLEAYISPKRGR